MEFFKMMIFFLPLLFIPLVLKSLSGIAIQQQISPLHNLLHIEVDLNNQVGETFNNTEVTINLPVGILIFLRLDFINSGAFIVDGPISSKITWNTGDSSVSSKQFHFIAFAHQPGIYQLSASTTDNQGVSHIYQSNIQTIHTPYVQNGRFAIAKNEGLNFNASDLFITIPGVTTAVTQVAIRPKSSHGTVTPTTTATSPFTLTYTPNQDFVGYDYFTVQAIDANGDTDGESIFVAVGTEDDPNSYVTFLRNLYHPEPEDSTPGAKDLALNVFVNGGSGPIYLIDYSLDIYHATLPITYSINTNGVTLGTASVDENGIFTYDAGETIGTETIPYRVTDANERFCDATMTVNVIPFS